MVINPITIEEAMEKGRGMLLMPRIVLSTGIFIFGFLQALFALMLPNGIEPKNNHENGK